MAAFFSAAIIISKFARYSIPGNGTAPLESQFLWPSTPSVHFFSSTGEFFPPLSFLESFLSLDAVCRNAFLHKPPNLPRVPKQSIYFAGNASKVSGTDRTCGIKLKCPKFGNRSPKMSVGGKKPNRGRDASFSVPDKFRFIVVICANEASHKISLLPCSGIFAN